MKIPYRWLKDYVDIQVSPEEYASDDNDRVKVEGIKILGKKHNVVVGNTIHK